MAPVLFLLTFWMIKGAFSYGMKMVLDESGFGMKLEGKKENTRKTEKLTFRKVTDGTPRHKFWHKLVWPKLVKANPSACNYLEPSSIVAQHREVQIADVETQHRPRDKPVQQRSTQRNRPPSTPTVEETATSAGATGKRKRKPETAKEKHAEEVRGREEEEDGTAEKGSPDMGPDWERSSACYVGAQRGHTICDRKRCSTTCSAKHCLLCVDTPGSISSNANCWGRNPP